MQGPEIGEGFSSQLPPNTFHFVLAMLGFGFTVPIHHRGTAPRTWGVGLTQRISCDLKEKLCVEVPALLPQESVVNFETDLMEAEEMVVGMPNLESLYLAALLCEGLVVFTLRIVHSCLTRL